MITIEECKKILNKGSKKYNEEEIKKLRLYLYFIGEIQLELENKEIEN